MLHDTISMQMRKTWVSESSVNLSPSAASSPWCRFLRSPVRRVFFADYRGVPGSVISKRWGLSSFRSIATDVAAIDCRGGLPVVRGSAKDLEVCQSSAEARMNSRAADVWDVIDAQLRALAALRAGTPNQAECKQTMDVRLKVFDKLEGKLGPRACLPVSLSG